MTPPDRTSPRAAAAAQRRVLLIDGSRLIVESLARAGADVFVGYPITPANLIYAYSFRRLPAALAAPDEITALQWMAGFAAAGRLPVTATSFPGFALMTESINMAFMMELPMVIVLAQRLGPATGSATCGAQGDLLLLQGMISGGHPVPVFCAGDLNDCWELPAAALSVAVRLRTPVILLTSKEMVMTLSSFDIASLPGISPVERNRYEGSEAYRPYEPGPDLVPPFLPVGNDTHQVRLTASTHDRRGILQHAGSEALANTARLQEKVLHNLPSFTYYELDEEPGARTIVVAFDITAPAARQAAAELRRQGRKVSLLVPKTLLPVPPVYHEILGRYNRAVIAEENLSGQYRRILYGDAGRAGVTGVNAIGRMLTPEEIAAAGSDG